MHTKCLMDTCPCYGQYYMPSLYYTSTQKLYQFIIYIIAGINDFSNICQESLHFVKNKMVWL